MSEPIEDPAEPMPPEPLELRNFSRADDMLRAAEVFWIHAARVVNPVNGVVDSTKLPASDLAFFAYLAHELVHLSDQLGSYRRQHEGKGLAVWLQYTPVCALPTEDDLAELSVPGANADDAMRVIAAVNTRWIRIFEELSERVTAVSAKELFANCKLLLDSHIRMLASACTQRRDA